METNYGDWVRWKVKLGIETPSEWGESVTPSIAVCKANAHTDYRRDDKFEEEGSELHSSATMH